ncbi:MAG: hypothetical protein V3T88_06235 [Nitrosomonadaceae bacterium]
MKDMIVRGFDPEKDYEDLLNMWATHESMPPPLDVLSPYGVWVEYKGEPVCCVFMYDTGCSMCIMQFVISNGKMPKEIRNEGLDRMVEECIEWAKESDFKYIYTATSVQKYINRLEDNGFSKEGTLQQHMFWGL